MSNDINIDSFLSQYNEEVFTRALKLRELLLSSLPGITEQLDLPAKMIAYCYWQRYVDMVCTIIPSKKGVKLGFYKGKELQDPGKLMEGTGKISRYVQIRSGKEIKSPELKKLILSGLKPYKTRIKING